MCGCSDPAVSRVFQSGGDLVGSPSPASRRTRGPRPEPPHRTSSMSSVPRRLEQPPASSGSESSLGSAGQGAGPAGTSSPAVVRRRSQVSHWSLTAHWSLPNHSLITRSADHRSLSRPQIAQSPAGQSAVRRSLNMSQAAQSPSVTQWVTVGQVDIRWSSKSRGWPPARPAVAQSQLVEDFLVCYQLTDCHSVGQLVTGASQWGRSVRRLVCCQLDVLVCFSLR